MPATAATRRRRLLLGFAGALAVVPLLAAAVYWLNPLGTASLDPRARLLGYVIVRQASASMSPMLQAGDIVLVSTSAYRYHAPAAGDIVVFFPPAQLGSDAPWVGRVIALPGEQVALRDGVAWVDGQRRDAGASLRPPAVAAIPRDMAPVVVDEGRFFMLGDNRDNAHDSRYWGTASLDRVVGRAIRVLHARDTSRIGTLLPPAPPP